MDNKMTTRCEKCGKEFKVPASMAGKKARCPCGNVVLVSAFDLAAESLQDVKWYYAKGTKRSGPVSHEEMVRLRSEGEIADNDLVWRKGIETWTPAAMVSEINVQSGGDGGADNEAAEAAAEPDIDDAGEEAEQVETVPDAGDDVRQWFYAEEGQQKGPVGTVEIWDAVKSGEMKGATLVWTEGMASWAKVSEVDEFKKLLPAEEAAPVKADAQETEIPAETGTDTSVATEVEAEPEAEGEGEDLTPVEESSHEPERAASPTPTRTHRRTKLVAGAVFTVGVLSAVFVLVCIFSGVLPACSSKLGSALMTIGGALVSLMVLFCFSALADILCLLADIATTLQENQGRQ